VVIGALLILLQAPRPESLRLLLRRTLEGLRRHGTGTDLVQGPAPESGVPQSPASHRTTEAVLDVLGILGLIFNAVILLCFAVGLVVLWTDPSMDLATKAVTTGLGGALAVPEFLLLRGIRTAKVLGPPVVITLVAAVIAIALSIPPSPAPWIGLVAALLALVGCRWYLRARRRLACSAAGSTTISGDQGPRQHPNAPLAAVGGASAAPNRNPWSPSELWLAYVVFPVLLYALGFAFYGIASVGDASPDIYELAGLEAEVLTLWIALLYLIGRKRVSWSALGLRPFPLRYLLVLPVSAVADLVVLGTFSMSLLPTLPALQAYEASLAPYFETPPLAPFLLFLGPVVVAPIVEELLFRGFFFTGFRSYIGPIGAAIISALLFSLAHSFLVFSPFSIQLSPSQALGAFTGGLVYAGLRHDSDSVFPSMLAHAGWNLLMVSL